MKYVGVHSDFMGHDGCIAVFDDKGKLECYGQAERYFKRIKHSYNILEFCNNYINIKDNYLICASMSGINKKKEINLLSIEDKFFNYKNFNPILLKKVEGNNWGVNFVASHHLCHIISSWCFRKNNNKKFAMSFDGVGRLCNNKSVCYLGGYINENGFELIDIEPIPTAGPLQWMLGPVSAGKAMGLAGYLNLKEKKIEQDEIVHLMLNQQCYKDHNTNHMLVTNWPDLKQETVAKFYDYWIEKIWEQLEKNIEKYENGLGVVVGGGTCLALELNTRIYNKTKRLEFCPAIDDSGLALGAAAFAYYLDKGKWPDPIESPSLMYLQNSLPKIGPQQPKEIAELIAKNKVVGLLRGKAEIGPRALGFRSILANAGIPENLERVSQKLKGREYYRPLAPMVTNESFDKYFIGPKGDYMQYKCSCTEEAKKHLPVIVHNDNSARPQVVYKEKDPWLHDLLKEYGKITGHECVVNTSLNGKNRPICNTYEDAVNDFKDKDIELISICYYSNS